MRLWASQRAETSLAGPSLRQVLDENQHGGHIDAYGHLPAHFGFFGEKNSFVQVPRIGLISMADARGRLPDAAALRIPGDAG